MFRMRFAMLALVVLVATSTAQQKGSREKVTFGKWLQVTLFLGPSQQQQVEMQVRGLMVNNNIREFTTGEPHDVTDRTFVVQRAYRVNDFLPEDGKKRVPKWKWQRGGWLLVDRQSGRITALNLPEFDPYYSQASWYRDLVAYCGVSDDAERLSAVVAQIGFKKPVVKQAMGPARGGALPESECAPPRWSRSPLQVTFAPTGREELSFKIRGHSGEGAVGEEPVPNL